MGSYYKGLYAKQLTESICGILKRCGETGTLSDSDLKLLVLYKSELNKLNKISLLDQILNGLKAFKDFMKDDKEENIDEL